MDATFLLLFATIGAVTQSGNAHIGNAGFKKGHFQLEKMFENPTEKRGGDDMLNGEELLNEPLEFEKLNEIRSEKRGEDQWDEGKINDGHNVFKRIFVNQMDTRGCKCSCSCETGRPKLKTKPKPKWFATDCNDILKAGKAQSGVYTIYPGGDTTAPKPVYCDQETDGGGWLVFQRRKDGSEDFYRGWKDYVQGFGKLGREFWLGLDVLAEITGSKDYTLRIDLKSFENETKYAEYGQFVVGPASTSYKLTVGSYSGTAGDSLKGHNGHKFSTKDKDNDIDSRNCAVMYKGAWWYSGCHNSNLNGKYYKKNPTPYGVGVVWYAWKGIKYSMKISEMKIRPS